jgi:hypothetical protein
VDPRAEAADAIRVGVLRGMATARLPYCYDEASFRRWVGGCLYHYRPEGVDPATLPAAVVEELIAKAGSVAPSLPNPWRDWPLLRRPVRALPELRAEGATRAALERALGVAEVPWADAVEIEDVSDLEVGR